jgi:uncharacterized protein YdhG (YjbR/CyaY superfamily)
MKKSASAAKPASIDEYLDGVPEPAHTTLQKLRDTIQSVLPREAVETISYGIPAFRLKKVVVYFAAFRTHCSFFPTAAILDMFRDELKDYKISKGTIQFPIDKPLSATLVKKMVKARLAQIETKAVRSKVQGRKAS